MAGKRQNEVGLVAVKNDVLKDIVADTVAAEVHRETGIACTARENAEMRHNLSKLEELVKMYDLNNPDKEVALYDVEAIPKREAAKKAAKAKKKEELSGDNSSK